MSTTGLGTPSRYLLGAEDSERARLLLQGRIHRAQAERLFERLDVGAGGRVLDVGGGPLGVLDLLSAAVGPQGEVIGLDNEPGMIAHASLTITELNLANVRLVLGEAADTQLAAGSLDLAHERLVLINHPATTGPGSWQGHLGHLTDTRPASRALIPHLADRGLSAQPDRRAGISTSSPRALRPNGTAPSCTRSSLRPTWGRARYAD